jgi:hypothetical protein
VDNRLDRRFYREPLKVEPTLLSVCEARFSRTRSFRDRPRGYHRTSPQPGRLCDSRRKTEGRAEKVEQDPDKDTTPPFWERKTISMRLENVPLSALVAYLADLARGEWTPEPKREVIRFYPFPGRTEGSRPMDTWNLNEATLIALLEQDRPQVVAHANLHPASFRVRANTRRDSSGKSQVT